MLCYLACYLERGKGEKVSRFKVKTEDEELATASVMHRLTRRGCEPLAILLLKGFGYSEEEYERMVAEFKLPPFKVVYLSFEVSAAVNVAIYSNAVMADLLNKRKLQAVRLGEEGVCTRLFPSFQEE